MATVANPRPTLRIRGRSFMALVLAPERPVDAWLAELDAQVGRAPELFGDRPVIVDLSNLPGQGKNLNALIDQLQERNIRIIGVEGADPGWTDTETWGRTPLLSAGRPDRLMEVRPDAPASQSTPSPAPQAPEPPAPPAPPSSLLLDQPVRSGQSVVFEHGDVTVMGSVSSGAEVIAGGSIHVYGALRGRAIAGITGRTDARIFCRRLEAELVAIAGIYTTADNLGHSLRGRAVQAWLEGDAVRVTPLD